MQTLIRLYSSYSCVPFETAVPRVAVESTLCQLQRLSDIAEYLHVFALQRMAFVGLVGYILRYCAFTLEEKVNFL